MTDIIDAELTPEQPKVEPPPDPPVQPSAEARAVALTSGGKVAAIVPQNLAELAMVASAVIKAGLAPDSYKVADPDATKSRIMIGIMKGAEVGLPPITALSTIFLVNNRPAIFGDGAIALVEASGKLEWMREELSGEPETDEWRATCAMKRRGQQETIIRIFTWHDAKRAGLAGKAVWKLYPQRMLQMRARAWAIRDGFADCLSGLAIAEEAQDMPAPAKAVDTAILDDDPKFIAEKPGGEIVVIDKDGQPAVSS